MVDAKLRGILEFFEAVSAKPLKPAFIIHEINNKFFAK